MNTNMKIKILIWDFSKETDAWLRNDLCVKRVNIVGHFKAIDDMVNQTSELEWDFLLCFIPNDGNIKEQFKNIFGQLKIPEKAVIYALDAESWRSHADIGMYLLKGICKRRLQLGIEKSEKDYISFTVEGISYILSSSDRVLLDYMYLYRKNWGDEELHAFYELSEKYYPETMKRGKYFFDIGANIGTSCIFFKKKVDADIRIIAFEPEQENYNLLKANVIINSLSEESILERYGVSDSAREETLYLSEANHGANSVLFNHGQKSQKISMISIDEYLEEKQISPEEIKYFWIDTEGFEPMVLKGAINALQTADIPILMEFSPRYYQEANLLDAFLETIQTVYRNYIVVNEYLNGKEILHPIEELKEYYNVPIYFQQDLFFLK